MYIICFSYNLRVKKRVYLLEKKREYNKKNSKHRIEYQKQRHIEKYKLDYNYKLKCLLRGRARLITQNIATKSATTLELIGSSVPFVRKWIESQFVDGMSWDNHGEWHIDHIRPCASFDLSDPEQQKECFNYKNLQPLWAEDNLRKGDSF